MIKNDGKTALCYTTIVLTLLSIVACKTHSVSARLDDNGLH